MTCSACNLFIGIGLVIFALPYKIKFNKYKKSLHSPTAVSCLLFIFIYQPLQIAQINAELLIILKQNCKRSQIGRTRRIRNAIKPNPTCMWLRVCVCKWQQCGMPQSLWSGVDWRWNELMFDGIDAFLAPFWTVGRSRGIANILSERIRAPTCRRGRSELAGI